jgi:hypothetical protein
MVSLFHRGAVEHAGCHKLPCWTITALPDRADRALLTRTATSISRQRAHFTFERRQLQHLHPRQPAADPIKTRNE